MLYHFKKWFFDLNKEDETYVYFFVAEIRFLFFTVRNFTFHCFDNRLATITRSRPVKLNMKKGDWEALTIKGKSFGILHTENELNIISDFKNLNIMLRISNYLPDIPGEPLLINHKGRQIGWFPLIGSTSASGMIKIDEDVLRFDKSPCYIDHVSSTVLPFNVPIMKMYWGRVIHSKIRISYSLTISGRGDQHGRCFLTLDERHYSFDQIYYEKITGVNRLSNEDPEGSSYKIIAVEGSNRLVLRIDHLKIAAEGEFIDPKKYKNKILYLLLSRISKNPRGKKYISIVEVNLNLNGQQQQLKNLLCVDEYVLF
jgi:hypothetical protein